MLVASMNSQELYNEIAKDDRKLRETTLKRIMDEYDRERKKLKIKKENNYFKIYKVKTAAKNNWLLYIHKCHTEEQYRGPESARYMNVAYYYDSVGLKVVSIGYENMLTTYNGHFFKRYNERIGLNLSQPLDIVNAFFANCGYVHADVIEKKDRLSLFGVVKDGLMLGDYHQNPVTLEWKTFITRDLKKAEQDNMEKDLIEGLQMQVIRARQQDTYNPLILARTKEIFKAITGRCTA